MPPSIPASSPSIPAHSTQASWPRRVAQLAAHLTAACALFTASSVALAEDPSWPNKPIRFIVPIAAGGVSDTQARVLSDELKKTLNVPVIVDNRPGGNFGIGMQATAAAPADGYTMVWIFGAAVALNPMLYSNLPYKVSDFDYLTTIAKGHHVLAVPKNSPFNTLAQFVDAAKKESGPTSVGVSSAGGTSHLIGEELGGVAGFRVQPVVYRGEAPAVLDLVGNNLPAFIGVVPSVIEYYKAGTVKILAITADQRIPELPDVPTFKELGYKDFLMTYWAGLAVRKGTPPEVSEKLRKAVVAAMATPAFIEKSQQLADTHLIPSTQKEFNDLIKSDANRWGTIIKTRNVNVE